MATDAGPALSVVVPTHQRAELLPRALASVLGQRFPDFEVVVVDDASTDGTGEAVDRIGDPRVRYVRHPRCAGAAAARNTGIEQARGELISFLDDDDEMLPGFLEEMSAAFAGRSAEVAFGWCGVRWTAEGRGRPPETRDEIWQPAFADRETAYRSILRSRRIGTNAGLTVRAGALREVGGFDERLAKAEDTDLLVRLARRFDFLVVPRVLIRIHLHDGPHLRVYDRRAAEAYRRILDKHAEVLAEDPGLSAALHYKLGWLSYHGGDRRGGRRALARALRARPGSIKAWLALPLFELLGPRAAAVHRAASRLRRRP